MSNRTLFHSLAFADVEAAMAFLKALGFTEAAVHRDPDDPSVVVHAQYDWRDTGGVMFGSAGRRDPDSAFVDSAGHGQCYCVVESHDEVDRIHDAALGMGALSVKPPADEDYGGRGCTVRDTEGNQWSFGTYPGE